MSRKNINFDNRGMLILPRDETYQLQFKQVKEIFSLDRVEESYLAYQAQNSSKAFLDRVEKTGFFFCSLLANIELDRWKFYSHMACAKLGLFSEEEVKDIFFQAKSALAEAQVIGTPVNISYINVNLTQKEWLAVLFFVFEQDLEKFSTKSKLLNALEIQFYLSVGFSIPTDPFLKEFANKVITTENKNGTEKAEAFLFHLSQFLETPSEMQMWRVEDNFSYHTIPTLLNGEPHLGLKSLSYDKTNRKYQQPFHAVQFYHFLQKRLKQIKKIVG